MPEKISITKTSRRTFVQSLSLLTGVTLLGKPFSSNAYALNLTGPVTVGAIMNAFIKDIPGAPFPNTVDTLKSGDQEIQVTGIVTCMFATIEVIREAITLGANFIIAHEPTFYNHQDATSWLEADEVFKYKSDLLKKHQIAVWRNHDYIHSVKPDGVRKMLVKQLGWEKYRNPAQSIYERNPPVSLINLIDELKHKLNIQALRYHGKADQLCKKILLMPGAAGGERQIKALSTFQPDVLVTGEISEWETAEYVRDAALSGRKLSLIVLGHVASEEPGSIFMSEWLKTNFPQLKTTFVKTKPSLQIR